MRVYLCGASFSLYTSRIEVSCAMWSVIVSNRGLSSLLSWSYHSSNLYWEQKIVADFCAFCKEIHICPSILCLMVSGEAIHPESEPPLQTPHTASIGLLFHSFGGQYRIKHSVCIYTNCLLEDILSSLRNMRFFISLTVIFSSNGQMRFNSLARF